MTCGGYTNRNVSIVTRFKSWTDGTSQALPSESVSPSYYFKMYISEIKKKKKKSWTEEGMMPCGRSESRIGFLECRKAFFVMQEHRGVQEGWCCW